VARRSNLDSRGRDYRYLLHAYGLESLFSARDVELTQFSQDTTRCSAIVILIREGQRHNHSNLEAAVRVYWTVCAMFLCPR
jgi:hypothetical protein